jgi:hypothetical protein
VKKDNNAPIWNEELVFIDSYPPLWQRIRVQLLDSGLMGTTVVGTHLIDLPTISSPQGTHGKKRK